VRLGRNGYTSVECVVNLAGAWPISSDGSQVLTS
jgi:hypothetical protein